MNLQKCIENSIASFLSVVKVLLLSKPCRFGKSDNKDCIILGNGPSLNQSLAEHHDFIGDKKRTVFVVNYFALSEHFETLRPEYYILNAPEFWLPNVTELHEGYRTNLYKILNKKTTWPLKILIPFQARKSPVWKGLFKDNKNIQIVYYNKTPVEGLTGVCNLLFSMNLGMPRPHNVLIPTIFIALNMEFKKIYIFGADHTWHEEIRISEDNNVTVNHQHFYDKGKVTMPMFKIDGQHFYIHEIFRKLSLAFQGYFVLKAYADYKKAVILNASVRSYIDAFEKVKI